MVVHRTCQRMDLHQRQRTWLIQVACFTCKNGVKTIQNHRKTVHELPLAKTVNLGNNPININHHMGMVPHVQSNHFQALLSLICSPHTTCHTLHDKPPVQGKDIQVMGHHGKDMTSTKVVMVGLKCSPLRRFHDKGHHFQVHWECLQDCQKTIQSIGQHCAALIVHLNLLPAHLEDP